MKKINFLFSLSISVFFVFVGYYLYFEKSAQSDNPTFMKIAGAVCMLFFGAWTLLGLWGLKKLFKK
ncbi:MAG: hypothetical protein WCY89_02050 [Flavobacteriaceae bacterium]